MIKKIAGIAATSFLSGCAMVGIHYGTEYTGHYTPRGTYYHEAGKTITKKQEIYPGDVMATISVIKAHTKLTSTSDCYIEWRRDGHSFIKHIRGGQAYLSQGTAFKKGHRYYIIPALPSNDKADQYAAGNYAIPYYYYRYGSDWWAHTFHAIGGSHFVVGDKTGLVSGPIYFNRDSVASVSSYHSNCLFKIDHTDHRSTYKLIYAGFLPEGRLKFDVLRNNESYGHFTNSILPGKSDTKVNSIVFSLDIKSANNKYIVAKSNAWIYKAGGKSTS